MADDLRAAALDYHRFPKPGKLEITATKKVVNQRDLALAYSPGVAAACMEIVADAGQAASLTTRANLVGVITNGTAVLGLGDIGPLASKPVMEGKAVLFKKFAGIDVFDLEVNEHQVDKFVEVVAALAPTFGGINLEDIKAPECFEIERKLKERLDIPVFHDDQHGTAITVAAAIRNGLRLANKRLEDVKLVCTGAGAAALACLDLLVEMGLPAANIFVVDVVGVVYQGRQEQMDEYKARYAQDTAARELADVMGGADIFMGLSAPRILKPEYLKVMAADPLVLALANPEPEILPELAREARPDAIIATGRSDYPNQVNNVLCFPFLFRGALDVGATAINQAMKLAAVEALAGIAMAETSDVVASAYGGRAFRFGRDYLLPKPFDPRLITEIPPKVARAAMESGVAQRPLENFWAYKRNLHEFVFKSGLTMKPIFERAMAEPKRIVFAEGESQRVLSAVQVLVDDRICDPVLIARPEVVAERITEFGLRLKIDRDIVVIDPRHNPNFERDWQEYHRLLGRRGVSPAYARAVVMTRNTALAALMVRQGDADAMICGVEGSFIRHLRYVRDVIGLCEDASDYSAVTMLILTGATVFLTDTHVTLDPSAEHIAETSTLAAQVVERFGIKPRVALLSHSNFGSRDNASARKIRHARELLQKAAPNLMVDGEMHADAAISESIRAQVFPNSQLKGQANLLVMPNLDAANISYNALKMLGNALPVGPMLVGTNKPAHVLTDSVTVRGIVNMSAVACVDAIDAATKSS